VDVESRRCVTYCPLNGAPAGAPSSLPPSPTPAFSHLTRPALFAHGRPPPNPPHPPQPRARRPRAGEPYSSLSVDGFYDDGEEFIDGELVEKWAREEPSDPFFPPIAFELMFVAQDEEERAARPVLTQVVVQPLGIKLLTINTTYTNWVAQPQLASAFAVRGLENWCAFGARRPRRRPPPPNHRDARSPHHRQTGPQPKLKQPHEQELRERPRRPPARRASRRHAGGAPPRRAAGKARK
jgi:hypothetical protein